MNLDCVLSDELPLQMALGTGRGQVHSVACSQDSGARPVLRILLSHHLRRASGTMLLLAGPGWLSSPSSLTLMSAAPLQRMWWPSFGLPTAQVLPAPPQMLLK